MGNGKQRVFVFTFFVCFIFVTILLLNDNTSKASQGDGDPKKSPIFANRLNTTLEAWQRQSKIINIAKRGHRLDEETVDEVTRTLRGLAYDLQNKHKALQETPPRRTQDPNDPRCNPIKCN